MIRTQVYLTPLQHKLLKKKAHEHNSTLSEELRKLIDTTLQITQKQKKKQNAGEWLLSMAEEAERLGVKGPPDLATNMDKYLYGEI